MSEGPTILKPEAIESESFRIIDSEIGYTPPPISNWPGRCIFPGE